MQELNYLTMKTNNMKKYKSYFYFIVGVLMVTSNPFVINGLTLIGYYLTIVSLYRLWQINEMKLVR